MDPANLPVPSPSSQPKSKTRISVPVPVLKETISMLTEPVFQAAQLPSYTKETVSVIVLADLLVNISWQMPAVSQSVSIPWLLTQNTTTDATIHAPQKACISILMKRNVNIPAPVQ